MDTGISAGKGKGGYLVRIESYEEYREILRQLQSEGLMEVKFYLGGRCDESGSNYYWVDEDNNVYGKRMNDTAWCSSEWVEGEPSYQDGEIIEACMNVFYFTEAGRWVWNDVPDDILVIAPYYSGTIGYIVEYEN